jgi:very-short-patch-repair endonuclease
MKELKIASSKEEFERLLELRDINMERALKNTNENLVYENLLKTNYDRDFSWERQYVFGYRIFDFYSPKFKVAVEVDGVEHNKEYDNYRDEYLFRVHGIVVVRCRNKNLKDIAAINKFLSHVGKFVYGKRNKFFKDVLGRCSSMQDRELLSEALPYDENHSLMGQYLRSKGFYSEHQSFSLKTNDYWRKLVKQYKEKEIGTGVSDKLHFRDQLKSMGLPFHFIKGDFLFSEDAAEVMNYRKYRLINENTIVLNKDFSFSVRGVQGEGLDKFLQLMGAKNVNKLVVRKTNKFVEFGTKDEKKVVLGEITLSEYMDIRCGKASKALTLKECKLFQIAYTSGWFEKNTNKTVPKQKALDMLKVISECLKVNISYRKRIKKFLSEN